MSKQENYPLLVLLGPTAVGKTKLSLAIAREINAEIISADSMQIYCKMNIGTAKVSPEIQKEISHHMIDIISPEENFSVAAYQKAVDKLIPRICNQQKIPLIVGGTGLYIKAVTKGFLLPPMKKNKALRNKLGKKANQEGKKAVHKKLQQIDPELAQKLHPNDLRRVIRGIEIYHQTGKTRTYYQKKQKQQPDRYHFLKIGLKRSRQELYQRINRRAQEMINQGLISEVKKLINEYQLSPTALQALGYKEIFGYIEGKYDKKKALRLIQRNTRHYAKKQLTWFKRDRDIHWFNLSKMEYSKVREEIITLVTKFIYQKGVF